MSKHVDLSSIEHVPRPDYIWPLDECIGWMNTMLTQIRQDMSTGDPDQLVDYLEMLRTEYASASMVQASMEWYYKTTFRTVYDRLWAVYDRKEKNGAIPEELRKLNGKQTFYKYIEAQCADIAVLHTLAERLHSSITHSVDALRTEISKVKEEMKMQQFGGGHSRPDVGDQTLHGSRRPDTREEKHRRPDLDLDFDRTQRRGQPAGYFPDESSPYAQ